MSEATDPRPVLMQSRDRDPLFEGATYAYALGKGDAEILVRVRMAPIFVHLLSLAARQHLRDLAESLVIEAREQLHDGDTIAVSPDGAAFLGTHLLRRLL